MWLFPRLSLSGQCIESTYIGRSAVRSFQHTLFGASLDVQKSLIERYPFACWHESMWKRLVEVLWFAEKVLLGIISVAAPHFFSGKSWTFVDIVLAALLLGLILFVSIRRTPPDVRSLAAVVAAVAAYFAFCLYVAVSV